MSPSCGDRLREEANERARQERKKKIPIKSQPKIFLSTPEVGEMLGVFHTTVRRWCENKKITAFRVGRNWKVPIPALHKFLSDRGLPVPQDLKEAMPKHNRIRFDLDDKQMEKYYSWREKHDTYCPLTNGRSGAIGGRTTFSFTPTGLGTAVTVECGCGQGECKMDLTDVDDW